MKKIVSSLCAFTLAFSLYGMPAMAFASPEADESSRTENALGPVKAEDQESSAVQEEQKAPVFNTEPGLEDVDASGESEEGGSLIDDIISIFTGTNRDDDASQESGGSDPLAGEEGSSADEGAQVVPIPEADASGASLTVTLFSVGDAAIKNAADAGDPLTLSVDGKEAQFAKAGAAWTASISDISAGRHDIKVSGAHFLSLTHAYAFEDGHNVSYQLVDSHEPTNVSMADEGHGFVPYGDLDSSGKIDAADARLMAEAYVANSTDPKFDLFSDGRVTLKDVELLAAARDAQASEPSSIKDEGGQTPVEPEIPDGTTVMVGGQVLTGDAAKAAIQGLLAGSGQTVTLTPNVNAVPGAEKAPISEGLPAEMAIDFNGKAMNKLTLHSPVSDGVGYSMPLAGTIKFQMETDEGLKTFTLSFSDEGSANGPLEFPEQPTSVIEVNKEDGTVEIKFGEDIKVHNVELTFTKASDDNTQIQLNAITTEASGDTEDPDKPTPELPTPQIPQNLVATVSSGKVSLSWDEADDAVKYNVKWSTATGDFEMKQVATNAIDVTTINGAPLKNGESYTFVVQSVGKDGKESNWSSSVSATPELTEPPQSPAAPTLESGYKEITVTWQPVDRADSYTLYYAKSTEDTYTSVPMTDGEFEYTIRGLENEVEYKVYISATNQYGTSADGKPVNVSKATTTFVTTKVPWFNLMNRAVQDPDAYPASDVFASVTANGSEEEGAKVVDGDYNTVFTVPEGAGGTNATFDNSISIKFAGTKSVTEVAISTSLSAGFADEIEDVILRVKSGMHPTTQSGETFSASNGLKIAYEVPRMDGTDGLAKNTVMATLPRTIQNATQLDITFVRTGGKPVTFSEVAVYEGESLQAKVNSLFAEDSLTELASGVDMAQIESIRSMVEATDAESTKGQNAPEGHEAEHYWNLSELLDQLDAAESLLKAQTARVVTTHSDIYGQTQLVRGVNTLQPLGAVAKSGDSVHVYVTPVGGLNGATQGSPANLKLVAAQHHGSSTKYMDKISFGPLKVGVNKVTMPTIDSTQAEKGGALYIENTKANNAAYEIKVVGAQEVPVLDLAGKMSFEEIRTAGAAYAEELSEYVELLSTLHSNGEHTSSFAKGSCIADATEIMTDKALISIPASYVKEALDESAAGGVNAGNAFATGLEFTDKMISILYQQAGLFDVDDPANADMVATYGTNNDLPSGRINFRFAKVENTVGGVTMEDCIAVDSALARGLGVSPTLDERGGKYAQGTTYSWDLSLLVSKAVFTADYRFLGSLGDFGAQMVTSKDKDILGSGQQAQHFNYDYVYGRVAGSGNPAAIDNLPEGLNAAILWQLHLAYDAPTSYSYTVYGSAADQFSGSIYAKMSAWVRNPDKQPSGLDISGLEVTKPGQQALAHDDAFARLASAATGHDLTGFFAAWRIPLVQDTLTYAGTFSEETRATQYISDSSRINPSAEVQPSSQAVSANVTVSGPENGIMTISGIGLKDGINASGIRGYEVLRQIGDDESTRQVIGFVPVGQSVFTDRLTSGNGQTVTYYVRAIDLALSISDVTLAGEAEATYARNLDKAYWTASSTMASNDDASAMIDGSIDTAYTGERLSLLSDDLAVEASVGEEDRVNADVELMPATAASSGNYASVTIDLGKPTDACGIRYFPTADAAATFKRLWVQVSQDGKTWTSVGYKVIEPETFEGSKSVTVYFTKSMVMPTDAEDGSEISMVNANYLRITDLDTAADEPIGIAEIDVIGALPDGSAAKALNASALALGSVGGSAVPDETAQVHSVEAVKPSNEKRM